MQYETVIFTIKPGVGGMQIWKANIIESEKSLSKS